MTSPAKPNRFTELGVVVIPRLMLPAAVADLLTVVDKSPKTIDHHREAIAEIDPLTIAGSGAEARYKQMVLGDQLCRSRLFTDLYPMVATIAGAVLGLVLEPGPRAAWNSCLNANLYTQPGDRQGWHVDTNPISALLILVAPPDAALILGDARRPIPNDVTTITSEAGDLVLLDGQRAHRVSPIVTTRRVNISFNLYAPGTYTRPSHTDGLLYA